MRRLCSRPNSSRGPYSDPRAGWRSGSQAAEDVRHLHPVGGEPARHAAGLGELVDGRGAVGDEPASDALFVEGEDEGLGVGGVSRTEALSRPARAGPAPVGDEVGLPGAEP